MNKAKGSSSGRTSASWGRSARRASRRRGSEHLQQGDLGEVAFLHKAVSLGFKVAKLYGQNHRYDFIVDGGSGLWRVQVKACAHMWHGLYQASICRSEGSVATAYTESEVDFVAVDIPAEKTWYVLPVRVVVGRTSLQFRPEGFSGLDPYAHYREAWHLLRQPSGSRSDEGERQAPPGGSVCKSRICDAKMYHMRKASVRDLRYAFKRIERLLHQGEEIQITKRRRVIARLVPESAESAAQVPDFMGRLRATYGDKALAVSAAELVSEDRDRY